MDTNAGYRLPVRAQVNYVAEWFSEWSEMQRGDFLPVLAQQFVPSGYVNGLVSGLEGLGCTDDRPPSLFQCRIKLFREWSENWGTAEREQFLNQIKAVDAAFVSRFEEEVNSVPGIGDTKVSDSQPKPVDGFEQDGGEGETD
ncbi:hypothetical protein Cfor_07115 [Coptotermes formosanus]|jgi:hypothetical protein|uniref:Uncharacterized protein n=1 Tax=Coptotermes formosanus TaxID=36987 RepID=A0A6L2Q3N7_COPFO|nr:hypothetical protein Cfor_07115 [Coptotermes formosanus]